LKRNTEVRSRNHCYRDKAISIAYCEFVFVTLDIHHAKRMRRVILSSEASPALQHFSSSQNGTTLGTQFLNKKCVF